MKRHKNTDVSLQLEYYEAMRLWRLISEGHKAMALADKDYDGKFAKSLLTKLVSLHIDRTFKTAMDPEA